MKKYIAIAAMIFAVAACSKEGLDNGFNDNEETEIIGIPFSAAISNSATTKALADGGSSLTATWAVNEEVALIYNDGIARKDVMRVSNVEGGVAYITGTITGTPADNTDVIVIYPATAADGTTGNILSNLLENDQVGTLADIAAKYDVRKGEGKLAIGATATFKSNISLTNQYAIFKFTVRATDGTTPINVKPLVITINAVDYTITPATATDVLYVALPAISTKAVSFTATDGSSVKHYCSKPSVSFSAGSYYQTTLKMSSQLGLPGQFSVGASKKVVFSQGNLQWFYGENTHKTTRATANTVLIGANCYNGGVFTFADHQWDICGVNNSGTDRSYENIQTKIGSYTNGKRIDLFVYSSSGFYYDNSYLGKPFAICNGSKWASATCTYGRSNMAGSNCDWGVFNAILNGGDTPNMWRTLTKDEWNYLINTRTDATIKRGFATVNGVRGLIILPDSWSGSDITPVTNVMSTSDNPPAEVNWSDNVYVGDDWTTMETNGALFLPASGQLTEASGSAVSGHNAADNNAGVSYWTATVGDASYRAYAFDLGYNGEKHWRFDNSSRGFARAVRLVRDVE